MRVLFITSSYPAHQDDPRGIFVHRLARSLCHEGAQVTVIAPGIPRIPLHTQLDSVEIRRVLYWIPQWQRLATGLEGIMPNLQQRPWLWLQVPTLIGGLVWGALRIASDFDIVHAHWLYPAGIAGVFAARRHNLPLIVTSQGGDLNLARRSRVPRVLINWVSQAADACVGVSKALCEQFLAIGVPPSKVRFISSAGVDLTIARPPLSGEAQIRYQQFNECGGFRLLYVGSLIPRKSVDTLLEAHYELEQRGYRIACAIVGPGPEEGRLRMMVQALGLRHVFFVGPQPPSLVPVWMSAAQALILPSLSEGLPNVVLEAMAFGLPVVATDIPGTREVVQKDKTGFLFTPRDEKGLADRIEQLIKNESLSNQLGQQAREYVDAEGLTTAHAVRRYLSLYEQMIALRRPRS